MAKCVARWELAGTNASQKRACMKRATHDVDGDNLVVLGEIYCQAHADDRVRIERERKTEELTLAQENASEANLCEREARDSLLHAAGRPFNERWEALSQAARKWVEAEDGRLRTSAILKREEERS